MIRFLQPIIKLAATCNGGYECFRKMTRSHFASADYMLSMGVKSKCVNAEGQHFYTSAVFCLTLKQ
jgi:hypothetical protein